MKWIDVYRGSNWRASNVAAAPWGCVLLTATPGAKVQDTFVLNDEDRLNPVLKQRLEAAKPAFLVVPARSREAAGEVDDEVEERGGTDNIARRASAISDEVKRALKHFEDASHGATRPAIGVVANRIGRARTVFEQLRQRFAETAEGDGACEQSPEIILMIGPARPVERDDLVDKLKPIRTRVWTEGDNRALAKPLILVATQCIEAGVDIDVDALVTEAAPLDSLRQRFGRLNRAGRNINPYTAIVADRSDLSSSAVDPVYGKAIKPAWDYLREWAKESERRAVDFGIDAVQARMERVTPPAEALTEKPNAPVLLPAHLDLLSQTSPIPAADPDVALYLHGSTRQPDAVTIVWRADIDPGRTDQDLVRLLTFVTPRSSEAIELPVWTVRRWLDGRLKAAADLADVPAGESDEEGKEEGHGKSHVFRWKGNDQRSQWIAPSALRPGDTIIVPAGYGGVDAFGWNPEWKEAAPDVAQKAAEPFAQRKFAGRVAPGLIGEGVSDEALATTLAELRAENGDTVRQALLDLDLPEEISKALRWLGEARGGRGRVRVVADFDLYGENEKGEPRGVVLLAPFGVRTPEACKLIDSKEDGRPNSTEDDTAGSIFGFPLSLDQHSRDVERKAGDLAKCAGLPDALVADLKLAGFLHDQGKRDPRFQAWLHFGDPLGFGSEDEKDILAKSGRALPPIAREKAGLPDRWRHEALSVRLARTDPGLTQAGDPDLVLWLVGTHHGYGRPFFPHRDPEENAPDVGPQSLAFDWNGLDWASIFTRLKARYGVWELARMEAILRLADHRASEEARERAAKEMRE